MLWRATYALRAQNSSNERNEQAYYSLHLPTVSRPRSVHAVRLCIILVQRNECAIQRRRGRGTEPPPSRGRTPVECANRARANRSACRPGLNHVYLYRICARPARRRGRGRARRRRPRARRPRAAHRNRISDLPASILDTNFSYCLLRSVFVSQDGLPRCRFWQ